MIALERMQNGRAHQDVAVADGRRYPAVQELGVPGLDDQNFLTFFRHQKSH